MTFFTTTAMPPKVPVLPGNEIEPRLSITGLSAQDIHALLRADEWCALESRNQQVIFLYDFARDEKMNNRTQRTPLKLNLLLPQQWAELEWPGKTGNELMR
jgi:hypothetical protein